MRGELIATAGSAEVAVQVEPADGKWRVLVDGRELLVDAVRIKPGTWSLLLDGRSLVVDVDESKHPNMFHTHRAATPIVLESAQRRRLASAIGGGAQNKRRGELIMAPIAGRVVKILVAVGETVAPGQGVLVLEAMKMENEIKAERGGVVTSVDVEAGQSVETRTKLLSLKPVDAA